MRYPASHFIFATCASLLVGCSPSEQAKAPSEAAQAFEKQLIKQFVLAKPGDVITIPAGVHPISRSLSLTADNVTIRGEGMDKSVLSFKGQIAGAEGILVSGNNFIIEDLAIEDAKGDGIKINEAENVIIRRIRTEWTNGPDEKNGAYGIYPVQTRNTLIEGSVAIAASDAASTWDSRIM
ncbi:parallel beta-helix domain-containing protein [Pseudobowmanella zhangzhouensis]|uniref:parallel beta-helix domain-containing protein n=1 Tax=Pseudobowmanella zhangzhouensis TaxID=1537679 RepID=UPI0036080D0F